jgi:nucleoside 2-deoxyribosyltransferase
MFSVYFAGELFSAKHLIGNAMLADAIARRSRRRFVCVLPQALEQRQNEPKSIRDQNILALLDCDLALFNFDGAELDSGTVVEFLFAKFADIPALLLRTDFRVSGDQPGDPWNLMNSFYPRTNVLRVNSMEIYQSALCQEKQGPNPNQNLVDQIAERVVSELDSLTNTPPILSRELAEPVYRWISQMPGFESAESAERVLAILEQKRSRQLLRQSTANDFIDSY